MTRLHLQGKVARRAFAQESLKTVTSPTSARKTSTKSSKSWCPQDAHLLLVSPRFLAFWHIFCSPRNLFTNWIYGDTSFLHSFLRLIGLFKAISRLFGSKKWSKWVRTHARRHADTDRRTSQFWGLLHKSPSGNYIPGILFKDVPEFRLHICPQGCTPGDIFTLF